MNNQFLKLSSSPLMNLDHTKRYSGTKLVEEESLSQHIVDTIMMGIKLIDEVNYIEGYQLLDPSVYVMKAVYHDMEEAITGDIPRPLKYYNEDTLKSMRDVAAEVARDFFSSQFRENGSHFALWDQAKEGPEGIILKIVDTLVVANKVVKEVTFLNNNYMLKVAHEVTQYLGELYDNLNMKNEFLSEHRQSKVYLLILIEDAINTMDNLLNSNADVVEELGIEHQSMI